VNQRAPPPRLTARSDVETAALCVVTAASPLPVVNAEAVVRAFAGPIPALI
jgi:hypothetical protein